MHEYSGGEHFNSVIPRDRHRLHACSAPSATISTTTNVETLDWTLTPTSASNFATKSVSPISALPGEMLKVEEYKDGIAGGACGVFLDVAKVAPNVASPFIRAAAERVKKNGEEGWGFRGVTDGNVCEDAQVEEAVELTRIDSNGFEVEPRSIGEESMNAEVSSATTTQTLPTNTQTHARPDTYTKAAMEESGFGVVEKVHGWHNLMHMDAVHTCMNVGEVGTVGSERKATQARMQSDLQMPLHDAPQTLQNAMLPTGHELQEAVEGGGEGRGAVAKRAKKVRTAACKKCKAHKKGWAYCLMRGH